MNHAKAAAQMPKPHEETLTINGQEFFMRGLTLAEAQLVDWNGSNFMRDMVFASLKAGGAAPEDLTPEAVEGLPYLQVYIPLWRAARRVNGLIDPGEATAAPGTTDAA